MYAYQNILLLENQTRPRGLMLTCERIHLLFDLSCKLNHF